MTDEIDRLIEVLIIRRLILPIDSAYIRGFITEAQWLEDLEEDEK